jgi:hypothetical protein
VLRVLPRQHNYPRSRLRSTTSSFTFSSGIPGSRRRDSEIRPSQKSSSRAPCFFRSIRTATLRPLASVTNWTPVMGVFSHTAALAVPNLFCNQLKTRVLILVSSASLRLSPAPGASIDRIARAAPKLRGEVENPIEVPDWTTFEQRIGELRTEYGGKSSSPLVYRGQGNSDWPLTTTLERTGHGRMPFRNFYRLITASVGPAVETFTGVSVPEYDPEYAMTLDDPELLLPGVRQFPTQALYRYMVYCDTTVSPLRSLTAPIRPTSRPFSHLETPQ